MKLADDLESCYQLSQCDRCLPLVKKKKLSWKRKDSMFRKSKAKCNCKKDMDLSPCLYAQVKYASENSIDLNLVDLYQS